MTIRPAEPDPAATRRGRRRCWLPVVLAAATLAAGPAGAASVEPGRYDCVSTHMVGIERDDDGTVRAGAIERPPGAERFRIAIERLPPERKAVACYIGLPVDHEAICGDRSRTLYRLTFPAEDGPAADDPGLLASPRPGDERVPSLWTLGKFWIDLVPTDDALAFTMTGIGGGEEGIADHYLEAGRCTPGG